VFIPLKKVKLHSHTLLFDANVKQETWKAFIGLTQLETRVYHCTTY